jgi:hypothetical protein
MSDQDWPDNTMENRRKVVRKTIHPATVEELKKLGTERFPVATDPWCEHYFDLLKQHASAKFYLAETPEGAQIVYCRDTGQGIWFLPGQGMGRIQSKGLQMLAEIVDSL